MDLLMHQNDFKKDNFYLAERNMKNEIGQE